MMQSGPATKPEGRPEVTVLCLPQTLCLLLAPTGKPQLGSLAARPRAGHTPITFSLQQGVEQPDNEEGTC